MQGFISDYKSSCGYKVTFWIFAVIYLLQVQIISGEKTQQPVLIPDSDETVVINSTSLTGNDTSPLRVETNVDAHVSDIVPKLKTLPKKVQIEDVVDEKHKNTEKINALTKTNPSTVPDDESFPPKHFPKDTDELVLHKDKLAKTLEKLLLQNTKEEHSSINSSELSTTPSSVTQSEFPPKYLPKSSVNINNVTIPLIINHNSTNIPSVFPTDNSTGPIYDVNKTSEVFDMTHSKKYYGQFDVDDVKHMAEKFNKTEMNNSSQPNPKSEVDISNNMDKNRPKLMQANKNSGLGVLSSTSNVVALSSAVLSSKSSKPETMLHPIKAIAATILTIVGMTIFGMAGFLLWRRIIQRRFGHREMLINEDDFEEISDLHHFQGTTPIAPNLIA